MTRSRTSRSTSNDQMPLIAEELSGKELLLNHVWCPRRRYSGCVAPKLNSKDDAVIT